MRHKIVKTHQPSSCFPFFLPNWEDQKCGPGSTITICPSFLPTHFRFYLTLEENNLPLIFLPPFSIPPLFLHTKWTISSENNLDTMHHRTKKVIDGSFRDHARDIKHFTRSIGQYVNMSIFEDSQTSTQTLKHKWLLQIFRLASQEVW